MPSPVMKLNSGYDMPAVGYGTWPLRGRPATDAVLAAIETGYRLLDTASAYGNEDAVGAAVRESGVPREELFVTTKLRGSDQGRGSTRAGLEGSLERLGLDYVDLYLIHWPLPAVGKYVESYAEMAELQQAGLIRTLGVSNFLPEHLAAVTAATGIAPAVNQLQASPSHARPALISAVQAQGTVVQAWSPLERNSGVLEHPAVTAPAERLGVTPAQIVLRWLLQKDIAVVPHSASPQRQRTNADLFGFTLTAEDVAAIDGVKQLPVKQDPANWEEF
ncbi:aldo/keto reductase [Dactylosporangium matsuzakiense]|uniref:Oxidoreductase n=1 Tax=Dactylosporangium matsuzakiense TaxID=53360 RepID=A0A9W6NTG2_9ACTN|nr:aldo/keto reductase [Dactylosporangium matsuzakiense]UWZ43679.1 aldo/keto reductase [Dactylosporangium matsuzakiense]GLL08172.1 oxidoreductase [Dactylosporangium matsuzakiense]